MNMFVNLVNFEIINYRSVKHAALSRPGPRTCREYLSSLFSTTTYIPFAQRKILRVNSSFVLDSS